MSDVKKVNSHLRSARQWLDEAEGRFAANDVVKGELTLSLVLAEIKHAWEVSRGLAPCAEEEPEHQCSLQVRGGKILFGGPAKGALVAVAVVAILLVGGQSHYVSETVPRVQPPVARHEVKKDLNPMTEASVRAVQREIPVTRKQDSTSAPVKEVQPAAAPAETVQPEAASVDPVQTAEQPQVEPAAVDETLRAETQAPPDMTIDFDGLVTLAEKSLRQTAR